MEIESAKEQFGKNVDKLFSDFCSNKYYKTKTLSDPGIYAKNLFIIKCSIEIIGFAINELGLQKIQIPEIVAERLGQCEQDKELKFSFLEEICELLGGKFYLGYIANRPVVIDYIDLRQRCLNKNIEFAEKQISSVRIIISCGAGFISAKDDLEEAIKILAQELNPIYAQYNQNIVINNNPFAEACFLLARLCLERDTKHPDENLRKRAYELQDIAIRFDPNNTEYC